MQTGKAVVIQTLPSVLRKSHLLNDTSPPWVHSASLNERRPTLLICHNRDRLYFFRWGRLRH